MKQFVDVYSIKYVKKFGWPKCVYPGCNGDDLGLSAYRYCQYHLDDKEGLHNNENKRKSFVETTAIYNANKNKLNET